ncbi:MAG: DUF565 domain-containing protein, partial [Oscillatoria sp. PMC 1076.18]|nr:DUF565 domain-containing protein [Oscillatoria sp. PMC 1076.18]
PYSPRIMQNTRLNNIFESLGDRLFSFFNNPWRRISLILISFLLGIFIGTAVSTTAGQAAYWDVPVAVVLTFLAELISRYTYRSQRQNLLGFKFRNSLFPDLINIFKIGLTFSLFIEAFKLGS